VLVPDNTICLRRFAGRWHGHTHVWGSRCRHHVRDEDARQGEVVPRQAGIIDVKVGWTFAETGAWHEAEGFERKEANKVFKVVAKTNEAIFYIGRRSKYFEEKLFVNRISDDD
jgi:hypothetical protein